MASLQCKQSNIIIASILPVLALITVCRFGRTEGIAVAAAGSTTNVTVGQSVLFPVSPEENSSKVSLLFNFDTIGSLSTRTNLFQPHGLYKDRIEMQEDGSIYLYNVQLSDSGLYKVTTDYMTQNKPSQFSGFHLQVFERVSKPNITAECRKNNISLSCSSNRGSEVTYSWETLPPGGNGSCVHLGQTMEIYPLPPSESTTYTCTAQNPASRATSDPIDLGVCSMPPALPQGHRRWILVLLAVFLAGTSICLVKKMRSNGTNHLASHEAKLIYISKDRLSQNTPPEGVPETSTIIYSSAGRRL